MFSGLASLSLSSFLSSFLLEFDFVEFREYVGKASVRCFDASQVVSHMRGENSLFLVSLRATVLHLLIREYLYFSCISDLLSSLIPCLIFLLMSFTWALSFLSTFFAFR